VAKILTWLPKLTPLTAFSDHRPSGLQAYRSLGPCTRRVPRFGISGVSVDFVQMQNEQLTYLQRPRWFDSHPRLQHSKTLRAQLPHMPVGVL
jgi:hypothetical protein